MAVVERQLLLAQLHRDLALTPARTPRQLRAGDVGVQRMVMGRSTWAVASPAADLRRAGIAGRGAEGAVQRHGGEGQADHAGHDHGQPGAKPLLGGVTAAHPRASRWRSRRTAPPPRRATMSSAMLRPRCRRRSSAASAGDSGGGKFVVIQRRGRRRPLRTGSPGRRARSGRQARAGASPVRLTPVASCLSPEHQRGAENEASPEMPPPSTRRPARRSPAPRAADENGSQHHACRAGSCQARVCARPPRRAASARRPGRNPCRRTAPSDQKCGGVHRNTMANSSAGITPSHRPSPPPSR